jgi:hypothetical protein
MQKWIVWLPLLALLAITNFKAPSGLFPEEVLIPPFSLGGPCGHKRREYVRGGEQWRWREPKKLAPRLAVKSSLTALLVGYGRRPAILPPFRSIRYHLNLCNVLPQKWQETFQYQTLKSSSDDREGIHYLRSLIRSHSKLSPTQVKLFLACCILHNLSVGC